MIQVEQLLADKAPGFMNTSPLVRRPVLEILKRLFHEREVNRFLEHNRDHHGFDFIDRVLEHFNFTYQASQVDRRNIPATGRVLIIANHPLGALDGLALLRLIGEVRPDVRIVANELLMGFDPLQSLFLPVDNLGRRTPRSQLKALGSCLQREEAVIIFPAGEVSRLGMTGIRDRAWNSSYLKLAHKNNAPLLPVHVGGRNSWLFYTSSSLYRPLASLLLAHEMFSQHNRRIPVCVGQPIAMRDLDRLPLNTKEKNKLVRRHLYRIARGKKPLLKTEKTIAHPQNRQALRQELKSAQALGETADGKQILLFGYRENSAVMRELGRLREEAFRQVGEGTGQKTDLDRYDRHYRHLILWDDADLEIAGAYRIGEAWRLVKAPAEGWIYSAELFHYRAGMRPYLERGIELGRSFVQPRYWGRRSLDYLWYGIGAYLRAHPQVRYLFGPVSLSGQYPQLARDLIVHFYRRHFPDPEHLAASYNPYHMNEETRALLDRLFQGEDDPAGCYAANFKVLRDQLHHLGAAVPTLYKQYSEVCEPGGVRFLDFGVDADFGFCIDGLVLVDTERLKPSRQRRYLGATPAFD